MKLRKVALIDNTDFRSLPKNFSIKFSRQSQNAIEPKCLVGLNGSGKSNLLELIAEIFYYVEMYTLYKSEINKSIFAFHVEYTLPLLFGDSHVKWNDKFNMDDDKDIKIIKSEKERIKFFIKFSSDGDELYEEVFDDFDSLLPNKIIGYSSGQNELLSNPFLKMRFHYVEKLRNMMQTEKRYNIEKSRLFWMEYSNNNAIVLSNFLLGKRKDIRLLTKELGIFAIDSFKINIDFSMSDRKIELTKSMYENIEKLKKCTPFWYEETSSDGEVVKVVLDYKITQEVVKAFRHHFVTSQSLFEVLYQLELFNLYIHKKKLVDKILKDEDKILKDEDKGMNISEEIPYNPERKVFNLKYIKLKKFLDYKSDSRNIKIMKYKSLSDGEHQFLQVFGSMMMFSGQNILFLFDEPETHFNPIWRSHMITFIDKITKSKEQLSQDILLTTHSPYLLSDSRKENILVFKRGANNYIDCDFANIKTFGASIEYITKHLFSHDLSTGNYSYGKLYNLVDNVSTQSDFDEAVEFLSNFGESLEKFEMCRLLASKKDKLV